MTTAVLPAFDDGFARALPELSMAWEADTAPAPALVGLNEDLAASLDLDPAFLRSPDGLAVLGGGAVPPGASPVALVYAGHQFGGYSPRLGDGRALLLGEVLDAEGRRWDVQLKGSGRTPFARGGDGKATLGPMLRELLVAEAMHALGIPTTRSLAVVTTGEHVARERMEPGAVLTRVAASHLRVGTFEYAARLEDPSVLARLTAYALERHHPAAAAAERPALALLEAVAGAQAVLLARWMSVGFVHGVMNTDNMTISGEGIDYGPCAFVDRFDPATVFSSIDHGGRYAYGNQPQIAQWNLARLAESLLTLIDGDVDKSVELATEVLRAFPRRFSAEWTAVLRAKLGLLTEDDGDQELVEDLFTALHEDRVDLTGFFRSLSGDDIEPLGGWTGRWRARLAAEGRDAAAVRQGLDAVNPLYIPRNHLLDEALDAAYAGDLNPFRRLFALVTSPYVAVAGAERYAEPAPEQFTACFRTFCGT